MRKEEETQLNLRFDERTVKLPQQVLEEVHPLLVALMIHAIKKSRQERTREETSDRQA